MANLAVKQPVTTWMKKSENETVGKEVNLPTNISSHGLYSNIKLSLKDSTTAQQPSSQPTR